MWRFTLICSIIAFLVAGEAGGGDVLKIEEQIMRHEGFSSTVYKDPAGNLAIGYGRNLESKGITKDEALILLRNDIAESEVDLFKIFGKLILKMDNNRRHALIDMRYNLGATGFREFKWMIWAIKDRDFVRAAQEMRDSLWYEQVGDRGKKLRNMMLHGGNE